MLTSVRRQLQSVKFNFNTRNNWKALSKAEYRQNYTKSIRLFALDFYGMIVNSAFGLINYQRE